MGPTPHDPHELFERIMPLRSPSSPAMVADLDRVRGAFVALGHELADVLPPGPDQTIAVRKLHEACQAAITAIVCVERPT